MRNNKKIWLGIDPGLARTGYGVIYKNNKNQLCALTYGCIITKSKEDIRLRVLFIYKKLNNLIKFYRPNYIAVEKIFFSKNTKTALLIGQIRGIIILLSSQHKIPLKEFTPLEVKVAVTGYGRAEKSQIQKMIKTIFNLKKIPEPDDTADALAIALCGLNTKNY